MDLANKHKAIVRQYIEEIGNLVPSDEFSETQIVLDEPNGHYILLDIGWQNNLRTYLPFVHIDVKPDGKVWIQHDGTDLNIAQVLIQRGIPAHYIVLGFKAPAIRPFIDDFAVA